MTENNFSRCTRPDCPNVERSQGLCSTHLAQAANGAVTLVPNSSALPPCSVPHCEMEAQSRVEGALCQSHYFMQWRGIDPETRTVTGHGGIHHECWVADCARRAVTKSLCKTHYNAARHGRLAVPDTLGVTLTPPCRIEGCGRHSSAKGLCGPHAEQVRQGREIVSLREWGKYARGEACAIGICSEPAISKDLCERHYGQRGKYGISIPEIESLQAVIECENAGCHNTAALCIDHDHDSGAVRGVLCSGCNTALGMVADDPARLMGLVDYLAANRSHLAAA